MADNAIFSLSETKDFALIYDHRSKCTNCSHAKLFSVLKFVITLWTCSNILLLICHYFLYQFESITLLFQHSCGLYNILVIHMIHVFSTLHKPLKTLQRTVLLSKPFYHRLFSAFLRMKIFQTHCKILLM